MGGECQRGCSRIFRANSAIAHCIGTRTYLYRIRNSMHVPIGGSHVDIFLLQDKKHKPIVRVFSRIGRFLFVQGSLSVLVSKPIHPHLNH